MNSYADSPLSSRNSTKWLTSATKKPNYKDENGKEVEEDSQTTTICQRISLLRLILLQKEEREFIVDYIVNTDNVSADISIPR